MMHGVTTLINSPEAFESRMTLVRKDALAILQHGPALVTVGSYVRKGSRDQNAIFHALCDHIATWWNARHPQEPTSKDRIKTDLKTKYGLIVTEYSPLDDRRKPRLASWSEYSMAQRSSLITSTLAWMAENGCPDLPEIPATEYQAYREAAA